MNEILIIIAFNLIVYFRTLKFTLIVDDIRWYKGKQDRGRLKISDIKSLRGLKNYVYDSLYGGGTFSNDTELDHLLSIFLHTTICVLMYIAFGQNQISFWAAMLYACNPINNQTAIWLNGRRYAINIMLTLLMVITYKMKYFWILTPFLYFSTGIFHATAFFAPLLCLKNSLWFLLTAQGFLLMHGAELRAKYESYANANNNEEMKKFGVNKLIVVVKSYGIYFCRMIFPGVTMMNYPQLFFWGVNKEGNRAAYSLDFDFYKGAGCILISVVGLVALPGIFKSILLFTILSTLQWSSIVPSNQILADRYASMPNIGMMIIVSYLLQTFLPQYSVLILIGFISVYLVQLNTTMRMYKDIWHYYEYQLYFCPWITTPRKDLVNYLINTGDFLKAWMLTKDGLKYTPNDFALLHRAAICAKAIGGRHQAKEYIDKAEKNFYLGQEQSQTQWIKHFRKTL